jgi:hypothetical protein
MKSAKSPARIERKNTVALRVSDQEKRDIEAAAQAARVGVSGFLRNLFYTTVMAGQKGQVSSLKAHRLAR